MTTSTKITEGIKNLIDSDKREWIFSHLTAFLQLEFHHYHGNVSNGKFRIWKLSLWIMAFYPVIHGTIDQTGEKPKVTLRTKMNSFGLTILVVIMGFWAFGIIDQVIIQENNDWTFLWKRILIGLIILTLPLIAIGLGYREQKRTAIEDLKKEIKNMCQQSSSNTPH